MNRYEYMITTEVQLLLVLSVGARPCGLNFIRIPRTYHPKQGYKRPQGQAPTIEIVIT